VLQTPAILLRRTRLTETSLIVTWLTPGHGRIKTVAKGALRPKSKLAGVLDLFHLCEIQFLPSRTSELHSLREAALLNAFPGIRTEYSRISLGAYAVELIERSTETDFPMPEIFNLLERALGYLNHNPASRRALHHFESELVRVLGMTEPGVGAEISLESLMRKLPSSRGDLLCRLSPNIETALQH
jgi:DNA repair protein RecO (recombination protein O)